MKNLNYRLLLSLLICVIIGLPACSDDVIYTHDSEGDNEITTIVKLTKSTLVTESYSEDRTQYYKETYRRLD